MLSISPACAPNWLSRLMEASTAKKRKCDGTRRERSGSNHLVIESRAFGIWGEARIFRAYSSGFMRTSMARCMPNRAILVTPPRRARPIASRVGAFVMRADPPPPGEGELPEFLQFTFSGLTVGAVYALVALGFTLIYNSSDVINFAQGEFVMLGGMTTVFLGLAGVPLPLAACLAIVFTVIVGLALHRFAIEPARGASA